MAYVNSSPRRVDTLIARPEHSDLSGVLDDIINGVKSAGSAALNFYNSAQQAQGAQSAYQSMTPPPVAAPSAGIGGISTTTILLVGGGALGLYFLLKK